MIDTYLLLLLGLAALLRAAAALLVAHALASRIRRGASVENLRAGLGLRIGFIDRKQRENQR